MHYLKDCCLWKEESAAYVVDIHDACFLSKREKINLWAICILFIFHEYVEISASYHISKLTPCVISSVLG